MGLERFLSTCIERFGHCRREERENFNGNGSYTTGDAVVSMLLELISMVVVLILVSLVGAYLWNNSAYVLFKGVNQSNWVNILAFTVLIKMLM